MAKNAAVANVLGCGVVMAGTTVTPCSFFPLVIIAGLAACFMLGKFLVYFNRTRCFPPFDEESEDGPDSLKRKLREAGKCWTPKP